MRAGTLVGLISAALLGLVATAIAPYQFGVGDQAQYLVHVIHLEEPAALAGDPYLEVFPRLGSVFWPIVAAVTNEASRPGFCLGLAVAVATLNVILLAGLGMTLLGTRLRAGVGAVLGVLAVPMTMVVAKEDNWFGLVSVADVELTATSAVMPLVFGSLLLWVRDRAWWSLACAAVAVPIHGQVGAYLLSAWWIAMLLGGRRRWRMPWLAVLGVAGGSAIALEASRDAALADPGWHEMMGRVAFAPLVDPLAASLRSWASVASVLLLGVAAGRPWEQLRAGDDTPHRRLAIWAVASCVLPIVGLLLLSLPGSLPLLPKLMVGRAIMLPQIVCLVWVGVWCIQALGAGGGRAILGIVVLGAVALWPFPNFPDAAAFVTLAGLAAAVLMTSLVRPLPVHIERWRRPAFAATVVLGAITVLGTLAFVTRPVPWLASGEDAEWRDVQAWARQHTTPGTIFVTPPYLDNWRVGSHRPTFGELKDGMLCFYAPLTLREWNHRMGLLGMIGDATTWLDGRFTPREQREGYRRAVRQNLDAMRTVADIEYVVTEPSYDVDVGEVVWSSDQYVIRELRSER